MRQVTIYTTPTCGYCKLAKKFFQEHGFEYTEKNVGEDLEAADEMVRKSDQMGVPVIIINDHDKEEIIIGFDQPLLSQLLNIG